MGYHKDMDAQEKAKLIAKVEAEVARLKALGWTPADFAKALKKLLS